MNLSDEHEVLSEYVEIIDVIEITEYDEETLRAVSAFLDGASCLVTEEWEWTEEGEHLWNVPSNFFWKLWHTAKKKLCEFGFCPRLEMEGDKKVWILYFHVEDFLRHSPEDVQEIDWDLDGSTFASQGDRIHYLREVLPNLDDGSTFASEVQETSAGRDFPVNDAQKAAILGILESSDCLVVSEWRWKADGQSLWNYPSESCLRLWQMNPELLRRSGFHVFSECDGNEKACILYFNITDKMQEYVLSVTPEPLDHSSTPEQSAK